MYALQAELLLAYYFFASGKFLQGKYHVTAAISLEISSGLNKVRSNQLGTTGGAVSVIPPPGDSTEEGERIRACWTGVILDKCWAVALVSSPNLVAGAQIDTPWPLEIEDYENVCILSDFKKAVAECSCQGWNGSSHQNKFHGPELSRRYSYG